MVDFLEEVKKQIAEQFAIEEEDIEDDSFLETDLNITELDLEDLCAYFEDKYQISIPQNAYPKFKKVTDLADYLYENVDQA